MGLGADFKEFAMKGNVVDMAVGVIVGAAFGASSLRWSRTSSCRRWAWRSSGVNFSDLAVAIGTGPDGKAVLLKYGAFLQTVLDFLIIAFVLFLAIRGP